MASLNQWTWVWANSRRYWRTGKPGVLRSRGCKELDMIVIEQQWRTNAMNNENPSLLHILPYCITLCVLKVVSVSCIYMGDTVYVLSVLSHSVVSHSLWASWTVSHQAPLSMGVLRQEYWSGLPVPSPWDLPNLGIKLASPALARRFFNTAWPRKQTVCINYSQSLQLETTHTYSLTVSIGWETVAALLDGSGSGYLRRLEFSCQSSSSPRLSWADRFVPMAVGRPQ